MHSPNLRLYFPARNNAFSRCQLRLNEKHCAEVGANGMPALSRKKLPIPEFTGVEEVPALNLALN
jgi:hypothetical protein